jgi:GGDEF domain-containing protein
LLDQIKAVFTRHENSKRSSQISPSSRTGIPRRSLRSDDLIARERLVARANEWHARFGGDEFCFMIAALTEYGQAYAVGERFREAVEQYDWTREDGRLVAQPVRVDVGVVCLWLGPVAERRFIVRRLSADLLSARRQADVRREG